MNVNALFSNESAAPLQRSAMPAVPAPCRGVAATSEVVPSMTTLCAARLSKNDQQSGAKPLPVRRTSVPPFVDPLLGATADKPLEGDTSSTWPESVDVVDPRAGGALTITENAPPESPVMAMSPPVTGSMTTLDGTSIVRVNAKVLNVTG
ncbi:MAG: hypothetical protein JO231_04000 [Acidobacteria bacterium]|nr:hypothetical protein [Acidobacteriota bacterium]